MRPGITWLEVVSDALIALAYFSILVTLVYFVRNRRDLPYRWMFVTFGLFIFACGMTHLVEIWSAWHGSYRLLGGVQAAAAVASLATSIMLVRLAPQGLTLPAPDDLRQTNEALEKEIAKRGQAETALAAARENFERQMKEHADELLAVKGELAAEQEAMIRLHEFGARMPASTELQPLLEEVLRASITLQSADFGIIELYKPKSQALEIVAQNGFRQGFLDPLSSVHASEAAWGRALRRGERVVIEDVLTDADFEPYRPIAASAGFRAVQFTPLLGRSGERFRHLIDAVRDYAIFDLDPGGRVVTWNSGAERITGYRTEEIVGQHIALFYQPDDFELKRPNQALTMGATEGRSEDEGRRVGRMVLDFGRISPSLL